MRKVSFLILPVVFMGLSFGLAAEKGTQNLDVQLREACRHVCVEARTADEVSKCVSSREMAGGKTAFKNANPQCYDVHQKYEARLEQTEPERYG